MRESYPPGDLLHSLSTFPDFIHSTFTYFNHLGKMLINMIAHWSEIMDLEDIENHINETQGYECQIHQVSILL